MGTKLKDLFKEAGIEDDRNITNHGLRVTSATTMFDSGFDSRSISMRTGHKSSSVDNYIRESQKFQVEVSNTLEPVAVTESVTESVTKSVAEDPKESPIFIELLRGSKKVKISL